MELIFWRHAEAAPGEPDDARPLTDVGRAQAERMARFLALRLPKDLRMLVSPARRAQETARALGQSFETIEGLAPGAGAASLLAIAGWPDAVRPVLLVGHQPTFGEAVSRLIGASDAGWLLGVGAVCWLRSETRKGRGEAALLLSIEPEILES
ncbi:MAG: SixA phosphatase family protein [Steroidobacteraceae bacterium]